MAGRNYGTMNMGYYYDEGVNVGYTITVGRLHFLSVAYHSKGQLIDQLVSDGFKKEDIKSVRIDYAKWSR